MTGQIPIRYVDPGQDTQALQLIARQAVRILAPGEEILFIAAENAAARSVKRDSVVITTTRIIAFRPGELARVNCNYFWQDILDVAVEEGILSTEIVIATPAGTKRVGWIAREQAARWYAIARHMQRDWHEQRRIREMQEARAKARGV